MPEQKNNLLIPGAIVFAGLLIAGGIYFSEKKSQPVAPVQQQAQTASIKPVTSTDHILGNPNAPIVVVEYSDTECPYCKMFQGTMHTIMDTYGKNGQVAWVYRHFPVHSLAPHEAAATECANELGGNSVFWNYIDDIFSTTSSADNLDPSVLVTIAQENNLDVTKFNTCLASGKYDAAIAASGQDAESAGAQGTPFSVMVLAAPLSSTAEDTITQYITTNGLSQYTTISSDKKEITLNGALPLQAVQTIVDAILKK